MRISEDVFIEQDALTVYTFLADGTNIPAWHPKVRESELVRGAAAKVGASYVQRFEPQHNVPMAVGYTLTAARPGVELEFDVTGGLPGVRGGFYFSSQGGGTVVRYTLHAPLRGLSWLFSRDPAPELAAEVRQLTRVKALLETELAA